jgi:hypothetical protein
MLSGAIQRLRLWPTEPDHVSTYLPALTTPSLTVEDILRVLGLHDPSLEELTLAFMWAGAFKRSGKTPQQIDSHWWGIQSSGVYALGAADDSYWPQLGQSRYQRQPTRIGVFANLPRGTIDTGTFRIGVGLSEDQQSPPPLIYRSAGRGRWYALGHHYRADTEPGFFDRLLWRALGAKHVKPSTISPSSGLGGGHHVITRRGCKACDSRPYAAIGAAGCMHPPSQITP